MLHHLQHICSLEVVAALAVQFSGDGTRRVNYFIVLYLCSQQGLNPIKVCLSPDSACKELGQQLWLSFDPVDVLRYCLVGDPVASSDVVLVFLQNEYPVSNVYDVVEAEPSAPELLPQRHRGILLLVQFCQLLLVSLLTTVSLILLPTLKLWHIKCLQILHGVSFSQQLLGPHSEFLPQLTNLECLCP